jgi:GAF domain-containing protein
MSETLILPPPSAMGESDTDGPPLFLLPARDSVERLLALARMHLGMEVAIVSEFTGDEQVLRHLEGDPEAFGLQIGAGAPLSDTYCWRVANGHLPPVIPDARADVRVRDLEVTWEADIGSYIGAPIRFSDGRLYGSVCCLSHSASPPSETGTPIS